MTRHYRDLGSASYCRAVCEICFNQSEALLTRYQYGISALVSQTSFRGGISGSVAKCRLFSQATSCLTGTRFNLYRCTWLYLLVDLCVVVERSLCFVESIRRASRD